MTVVEAGASDAYLHLVRHPGTGRLSLVSRHPVVLLEDGEQVVTGEVYAELRPDGRPPGTLAVHLVRRGEDWLWMRYDQVVGHADQQPLRPVHAALGEHEVLGGGVRESVYVHWTRDDVARLAAAEHPHVRVGLTDLWLHPLQPWLSALWYATAGR